MFGLLSRSISPAPSPAPPVLSTSANESALDTATLTRASAPPTGRPTSPRAGSSDLRLRIGSPVEGSFVHQEHFTRGFEPSPWGSPSTSAISSPPLTAASLKDKIGSPVAGSFVHQGHGSPTARRTPLERTVDHSRFDAEAELAALRAENARLRASAFASASDPSLPFAPGASQTSPEPVPESPFVRTHGGTGGGGLRNLSLPALAVPRDGDVDRSLSRSPTPAFHAGIARPTSPMVPIGRRPSSPTPARPTPTRPWAPPPLSVTSEGSDVEEQLAAQQRALAEKDRELAELHSRCKASLMREMELESRLREAEFQCSTPAVLSTGDPHEERDELKTFLLAEVAKMLAENQPELRVTDATRDELRAYIKKEVKRQVDRSLGSPPASKMPVPPAVPVHARGSSSKSGLR